MEWFYIIQCDNIFDKKKAIMGSFLGINFYNFLCWMPEQKLGLHIWHCTSHVALILYSTSKARNYCCFTLSAHNLLGVRIPIFPHTNKIKRGMAVKTPGEIPFQQQDWALCFVGDHFYDVNTWYFGLKEKGCKAYFSCWLEYNNKWYM